MWQKRPKKAKPSSDDSAGDAGTDFDEAEPPVVTLAIVRERAMRLLVHREHGRKELEQKLLQRELPPDLIASALDKLAEEGLQCDTRFAESYTRMRIGRGHGANKIRADLYARQLEQSIAERAISSSGADWDQIALEALEKKFARELGSGFKLDFEAKAKMQRYLYRRGFETSEIKAAIKEYELCHSEVQQ